MLTGCAFFFTSLLFLCYFLILKFFGETEIGWTSSDYLDLANRRLTINGDWSDCAEYIGKVYQESKRRPKYIVDIDLLNLSMSKVERDQEGERKRDYLTETTYKKGCYEWTDSNITAFILFVSRSKSHSLKWD